MGNPSSDEPFALISFRVCCHSPRTGTSSSHLLYSGDMAGWGPAWRGNCRKRQLFLQGRPRRPLHEEPRGVALRAERRDGQIPADRSRNRTRGTRRKEDDTSVLRARRRFGDEDHLAGGFERHRRPSRVVECSSLEEGIVDDTWRPIVAKKRTVEFVSIFVHRSAKIRPSSLHVVAAEIVQKIAKVIGNGRLESAGHELGVI